MSESVTIAVDACGGDFAPQAVLDGVALALDADRTLEVRLVGPSRVTDPFCKAHERCVPVHAEEIIGMGEHPADAVKAKRDSSIVVGCQLVRAGEAQGFFSAGSTGACLVASTLEIGRIKGVKRPALAIIVPAYKKPTLLLDVGANADCKPAYLLQFAQMGAAYMRAVMNVSSPSVGLLNIGEEPTKGSMFAQECHQLLSDQLPEFAGNCEGGALMQGDFDVVVCDGFTGNVALKSIEGTSKMMVKLLKDAFTSSLTSKLGAVLSKGGLRELKKRVSPDTYGGSPLLGVNGVSIVGHGSSSPVAVCNGILTGCREVRGNLTEIISGLVNANKADMNGSDASKADASRADVNRADANEVSA